MILQALTRYYEILLKRGKIAASGWSKAKVSWALELSADGSPLLLLPLQQEVQRGKKTLSVPQELEVPAPVKRTVGVAANFLCDNSGYLLGADAKGNPGRTADCFAAAKALHLNLLASVDSPAARAVTAFFERWDPAQAASCPALQQDWEELIKGGNLIFWYDGEPVTTDSAIRRAWEQHYSNSGEGKEILCLVTGKHAPLAVLHPSIKGVQGAQSSGASLVSFNAPSFWSYGHDEEQGGNAPTGTYAAFAYGAALNYLIADREHMRRIGDTTVVCWAEGGEDAYQDFTMMAMFDDEPDEGADAAHALAPAELRAALEKLASGEPADWPGVSLDPNCRFYILGLAPNASRLSVRFFWQNSFGLLAQNIARHYERLEIVRPSFDPYPTLPVWRLLRETVNLNARTPEPSKRLSGDLLLAILTNGLYPATLLTGVTLRIRAEQTVNRGRAAILKAYYLRNSRNESLKEVMTVELNEQSSYVPYVLGRLFSVLEAVQAAANPGINTTIRERYFNSASATPAVVFPTLLNLAQKHLSKLEGGLRVFYDRRIGELLARIHETLPARLTLEEQGAFQLGYYHETQKRYTKKEEQ